MKVCQSSSIATIILKPLMIRNIRARTCCILIHTHYQTCVKSKRKPPSDVQTQCNWRQNTKQQQNKQTSILRMVWVRSTKPTTTTPPSPLSTIHSSQQSWQQIAIVCFATFALFNAQQATLTLFSSHFKKTSKKT